MKEQKDTESPIVQQPKAVDWDELALESVALDVMPV